MQKFDENPILNSPYSMPDKHWILDSSGQPTGGWEGGRRPSTYLIPMPATRRQRRATMAELPLGDEHKFKENAKIKKIRECVDEWRNKPPERWKVTGATQTLLEYWRRSRAQSPRPFFCQVEAAETLIWLNEVAPQTAEGKNIIEWLKESNREANPDLFRLAAKMATGSGKTTVMAMLIAYHVINKSRYPQSGRFSNAFLIITPGITIHDRLRVLLPHDPDNYYEKREIVPRDMLGDIKKARVVIRNYHAFMPRETRKLSAKEREVLRGHDSQAISTKETEGQMLMRVCGELLRAKDVIVINDEAHHCYRHKDTDEESPLHGEEREDAKENNKAARVWISGIEALKRRVHLRVIYDLSATPFFLRGSGYTEGTLFPWVVSDFALMDAIEAGVVKLPRLPIDDGATTPEPIFRNLYHHIRDRLPKKGAKKQENLDPDNLPGELCGALKTLYDYYKKVYAVWEEEKIDIPPVFIIVCNNSSTSKLVYEYISGFKVKDTWRRGALELFSNIDEDRRPFKRPYTLLIDSRQLESGDALSDEFKKIAAPEIEVFKQDMRIRQPGRDTSKVSDAEILREVMNTVGKKDKLGEQIRCVVSVSMLTEGWDTNNVTHILGVRAFGTQLLCEQVVGRALRRLDYSTDENGMFAPEYADIFGVPFSFIAQGKATIKRPKPLTRVRHLEERSHLAITFPRIRGYKYKPPDGRLVAKFSEDSRMEFNPDNVPPIVEVSGIVGEARMMTLDELKTIRMNEVVYFVAMRTVKNYYRDKEDNILPGRFRDLVPIVREYIKDYVRNLGGTHKQYLLWGEYADQAAENIHRACTVQDGKEILLPIADPFTPSGYTHYVDFLTSKKRLHESAPDKSHVNIAVCDSDWEMIFCRILEDDKNVFSYVRNAGLSFAVPYTYQQKERKYYPDFIAVINDRDNKEDMLHLIVETKGRRDEKDQAKADTMNRWWIPAVNNDGRWGRWAFEEILDMQNARKILAGHSGDGQ